MADRTQAFFRQLVDSVFFTAGHDGLEDADRNFAVDIGAIGIISGLVATQHAPTPDLTIDLTGPGTAYDQAGRRMFVPTATSGFDCSQDEDGNPTAVTTPGNERWCSVQLRFDRTLASPEVDGNGVTVYTDQDESFELAVVRAGEFAIGTNTKPALPADGRLICDFRLINGQTQIFTVGDIYTDRRQDFQIFSAAQIPVTPGSLPWTFLSPATNDVQATLDFIDQRILRTDGSRQLTENLVPDAAARDLGASGNEWDLYLETLTPSVTARVDGNLIPKITGADLGTTLLRWSLFADLIDTSGNIKTGASSRIDGNLIPNAGTELLGTTGATNQWAQLHFSAGTCYTSLLPDATGKALGSAGAQFDAHIRNQTIYNTLKASADGKVLGDASFRFVPHLKTVLLYDSTITGALKMSAAKTITQQLLSRRDEEGVWTFNPSVTAFATTRYLVQSYQATGPGADATILLDGLKDGSTLTELQWSYGIEVTVGGVTANATLKLYKKTSAGARTQIGGTFSTGTTGSWQDDAVAVTGLSEVIDLDTYTYWLELTAAGTAGDVTTYSVAYKAEYTIDDIGVAAAGGSN